MGLPRHVAHLHKSSHDKLLIVCGHTNGNAYTPAIALCPSRIWLTMHPCCFLLGTAEACCIQRAELRWCGRPARGKSRTMGVQGCH